MEKPKCRICQERHYGVCGPGPAPEDVAEKALAGMEKAIGGLAEVVFEADRSGQSPEKKPKKKTFHPIDQSQNKELLARVESLENRVEVLEDRKKYMRDYMRERRKK